jgi:hypothetical protein
MGTIRTRRLAIPAALALGLMVTACDGIDGVDINAPLLDAVGVNLMGKPRPEPNLPERAPLVLPPSTSLPEPGERSPQVATANGQQWPQDPDQLKKEQADAAEAARQEYCRTGNWSANAGIDDFRKNTGLEARCRPEWVEKMNQRRAAQQQ